MFRIRIICLVFVVSILVLHFSFCASSLSYFLQLKFSILSITFRHVSLFLGFIQRQAMQFFNAVQLVAAGPPRDADLCACVLLVLAAAASPMLGGEEVERLRQHFRQTWEAHAQVPAPRAHFEIAVARTVNLAFLTPRGTFGQPVYNHGLP